MITHKVWPLVEIKASKSVIIVHDVIISSSWWRVWPSVLQPFWAVIFGCCSIDNLLANRLVTDLDQHISAEFDFIQNSAFSTGEEGVAYVLEKVSENKHSRALHWLIGRVMDSNNSSTAESNAVSSSVDDHHRLKANHLECNRCKSRANTSTR